MPHYKLAVCALQQLDLVTVFQSSHTYGKNFHFRIKAPGALHASIASMVVFPTTTQPPTVPQDGRGL